MKEKINNKSRKPKLSYLKNEIDERHAGRIRRLRELLAIMEMRVKATLQQSDPIDIKKSKEMIMNNFMSTNYIKWTSSQNRNYQLIQEKIDNLENKFLCIVFMPCNLRTYLFLSFFNGFLKIFYIKDHIIHRQFYFFLYFLPLLAPLEHLIQC